MAAVKAASKSAPNTPATRSRKPRPHTVPSPRRGRPEVNDRSQLKTVSMTVCLTIDQHKAFKEKCGLLGISPATKARSLIEECLVA